jgi:hypothetical protein
MPRSINQKHRHESPCSSLRMIRTAALVAIGFAFGTMVNLTNSLTKGFPPNDRRVLSQDATTMIHIPVPHEPAVRGPRTPRPAPHARDMTNGRGWINSAESDLLKERLQALDKRLKSLQTTPPRLQQQGIVSRGTTGPRTQADIQYCRDRVFTTTHPPVAEIELDQACNDPSTFRFNVCHDLHDFTGLTMDEVIVRMARLKQFHFEEEHMFWNPQTATQVAWYYSTSQSYLFANAIHGANATILDQVQPGLHEPVLDYSGGVGNSVLYLAMERGLECQYFGIGMVEQAFAQFRVAKRGLDHLVTFRQPWSESTGWRFDPIQSLPRDGSLGSILAEDVLGHIPNYHLVVAAMVDSLRVGGIIIERSLFAASPAVKTADTRIQVHSGGVSMVEAMGSRMIYREEKGYWEKIRA